MCRWWVFSKCCCLCLAYLKCILFWQFAYALPLLHFKLIIPKTHSDKIWTLLCSGSGVSSCEMHQYCFNKIYNVNSNVFGRRQKKKKTSAKRLAKITTTTQVIAIYARMQAKFVYWLVGSSWNIDKKKRKKNSTWKCAVCARWAYVG